MNKEFEAELKAIDPRLTLEPNLNRPGISNIKLNGKDVIPVPDDLREEHDPNYVYQFPQGAFPHTSKKEALARVRTILDGIKDPDFHDAFFGLGEYAEN